MLIVFYIGVYIESFRTPGSASRCDHIGSGDIEGALFAPPQSVVFDSDRAVNAGRAHHTLRKVLYAFRLCCAEEGWRYWLRFCHSFYWKLSNFRSLRYVNYLTSFENAFAIRVIFVHCCQILRRSLHTNTFLSIFAYKQIRQKASRSSRVKRTAVHIYGRPWMKA